MTPGGVTDERVQERRTLLQSIDAMASRLEQADLLRDMQTYQEKAFGVILGESKKAFDLSQEPDELRDRYGRNSFGQSCLLARRLVENGVPFITINMGGWDTHTDNFNAMKNLADPLDKGLRHACSRTWHSAVCSRAPSSSVTANSAAPRKSTGRRPGTAADTIIPWSTPVSWRAEDFAAV